jgi:retron-type reverse transcriptase
MKRVGFLYDKILDPLVIEFAIMEASRGKRHRASIRHVLENMSQHVAIIQDMLNNQTFKPSPYHVSMRYDHRTKKTRKIQRPIFFPDQIIHWLIILAVKEVFLHGMYYWNCGSIPGRGINHGHKAITKWLTNDIKGTKYTCKLDVKKFYDSIPHDKLMETIKCKVKDKRMLSLIQQIISTTDSGIPIGNYTSQWFANIYLEKLDHFIKQNLGIKYYVRYIDDLVFFGNNKKVLHKARTSISNFLSKNLGLELKANWQVFKTDSRGVDFLGYVFYHTHIKLRARNFLALTRQCNKVHKFITNKSPIPFHMAAGLLSRIGQFQYFNSRNIREKYLQNIKINLLKGVVRNESKRKLSANAI